MSRGNTTARSVSAGSKLVWPVSGLVPWEGGLGPSLKVACSTWTLGGRRLLEDFWRPGSVHLGGAGSAGPPPVGLQPGLQCSAEARQVAVVDAAVVQLLGQLAD